MPTCRAVRERRAPERTVLYRVLQEHLETFLIRFNPDGAGASLPRFVERALRGFLDCGILARGFCRVHCPTCHDDALVAFSCKRRGFCPACGARRMADTAAHLVDHVFPEVPIRNERLALTEDGKVVYKLKNRWRDGSTHVVLEPMTFLERLCALVPRPVRKTGKQRHR